MTIEDQSSDAIPECDVELDASGMRCPQPLIQAKLALNGMAIGEVLLVIATDPGTRRDFQVQCALAGHTLLDQMELPDKFLYWIRRG